jgi:O-acetyl-ADP-ribose deacetylase (regulator of RNase III)
MHSETGNVVSALKHGVLLQQVNAQGVMRSGIAKDIREKWPAVFTAYKKVVVPSSEIGLDGIHHLGKVIPVEVEPDLWVVSIVGQRYYGKDGRRYTSYDALASGFEKVATFLKETGFTHKDVHHPLLGCGLGGAEWSVVEALITHHIGPETTLWVLPGAK